MKRRIFLMAAAAGSPARPQYTPRRKYRAVIIGDTGRGNYGHGWEMMWAQLPQVEVAAVADPDQAAGEKVRQRSGAKKLYRDYREMIAREKPDIVTIGPRWCDQRFAMIQAATDAGAHIVVEKPLAASLPEADRIVAMIERKGVKCAVGHTARVMSVTSRVRDMLGAGELGSLQELRGRGKEDKRAGGEDLIVLGTHVFDLMRYYAGDPEWIIAHVTQGSGELRRDMMHQASEPVGQVGGDQIAAMFLFPNGVHGYFGSKPSDAVTGRRFGLTLAGSKAWTFVPLNSVPSDEPYVLRSAAWVPESGETWERVNYAAGSKPKTRELTNHLTAVDLLEAIEKDRPPACSARDGLWTIEMVAGIYASQLAGNAKVTFPLQHRTVTG
jgi:predicted dehydrogenase